MEITLKVTPEALKEKAAEVEAQVHTLQRQFEDVQDIVARTTGY